MPQLLPRVLELLVDDTNTDILLVPITGVFPGMSDARISGNDLEVETADGPMPRARVWKNPPTTVSPARIRTGISITGRASCGTSTGRAGDGLPPKAIHHMRPV